MNVRNENNVQAGCVAHTNSIDYYLYDNDDADEEGDDDDCGVDDLIFCLVHYYLPKQKIKQ